MMLCVLRNKTSLDEVTNIIYDFYYVYGYLLEK